jgi:hypothetical protein
MPTTDRTLRVFLCHASQDKPIVRELYQRLNAEGWIDPWLDEEKLLPGQDWDMEIERAVEVSDAVIVILSTHSVAKEGYVQREFRYVLDIALEKPDGSIFIIPLRLDDCEIPRRLRTFHYADYYPEAERSKAYGLLITSLKKRSESIKDYGAKIIIEQTKCPICRDQIDLDSVVVRCESCGIMYHVHCWNYLKKCVQCGSTKSKPFSINTT